MTEKVLKIYRELKEQSAFKAELRNKGVVETEEFCRALHEKMTIDERRKLRAELGRLLADPQTNQPYEMTELDFFTDSGTQRVLARLVKAVGENTGSKTHQEIADLVFEIAGNTGTRDKGQKEAMQKQNEQAVQKYLGKSDLHPTVILQALAVALKPHLKGEKAENLANLNVFFADSLRVVANHKLKPLLQICWEEESHRLVLTVLNKTVGNDDNRSTSAHLAAFNAEIDRLRQSAVASPKPQEMLRDLDQLWEKKEEELAIQIFREGVEEEIEKVKMFLEEEEYLQAETHFNEEQLAAFRKLASEIHSACRAGRAAQQKMRKIHGAISASFIAELLRTKKEDETGA